MKKLYITQLYLDILMNSYFVFGFLFGLYVYISRSEGLALVISLLCVMILFIVWLRLDYIKISQAGIMRHYNYFFSRNLNWHEISSVAAIAAKEKSNRKYSAIKMSSNNQCRKDVIINIIVLSKNDVKIIAEALINNTNPNICNEEIRQFAQNWAA
jgi:hypothetical protein